MLGGWNFAISAFSQNSGAALAYINFATTPEWQKHVAMDNSQAPVNEAAYSDPEVLKDMPFAAELLASAKGAKPRPLSPVYPQISQAIYKNVHSVLSGSATADEAAKKMAEEIKTARTASSHDIGTSWPNGRGLSGTTERNAGWRSGWWRPR